MHPCWRAGRPDGLGASQPRGRSDQKQRNMWSIRSGFPEFVPSYREAPMQDSPGHPSRLRGTRRPQRKRLPRKRAVALRAQELL